MSNLFEKFVKKLRKNSWSVIDIVKLKWIGHLIYDEDYTDRKLYTMITRLKKHKHLFSLKKDLYYIPSSHSPYDDKDKLIHTIYRPLVKKYCPKHSNRCIGWITSLDIHLSRLNPPTILTILSPIKHATETIITNHTLYYKCISKKNPPLWDYIKSLIHPCILWWIMFPVVCPEIALLEALSAPPDGTDRAYLYQSVIFFLKKNWKKITTAHRSTLLHMGKYNTATNRLLHLARTVDPSRAETIHTIIKTSWTLLPQSAL